MRLNQTLIWWRSDLHRQVGPKSNQQWSFELRCRRGGLQRRGACTKSPSSPNACMRARFARGALLPLLQFLFYEPTLALLGRARRRFFRWGPGRRERQDNRLRASNVESTRLQVRESEFNIHGELTKTVIRPGHRLEKGPWAMCVSLLRQVRSVLLKSEAVVIGTPIREDEDIVSHGTARRG